MSDNLISKSALMEDFRNTITENSDTFDWWNMIQRQPTAYDVDKVIEKLLTYISQQSENEMLSDNGKWLVKRVIEECIEIVKSDSAVNK